MILALLNYICYNKLLYFVFVFNIFVLWCAMEYA